MINGLSTSNTVGQYSLVAAVGFIGGSVVKMIFPFAAVTPAGAVFFGLTALTIAHIAKHTFSEEIAIPFGACVGFGITISHGYYLGAAPLAVSYIVGVFSLSMLKNFIAAH